MRTRVTVTVGFGILTVNLAGPASPVSSEQERYSTWRMFFNNTIV